MKGLLILCLVVAGMSVELNNDMWTMKEKETLTEIQTSNWAKYILSYAELDLQSGGILDDLLQAIQELLDQLHEELEDIQEGYSRRTDQHNRDVTRLESEIQDGERDIFNGQDMIDNVLYPQRDRFQKALAQLKANIEENRNILNEETVNRKKGHEEFLSKVAEINEAIGAVDESLQLLGTITNPALVQFKRVQTNLERIHTAFQNHSVFAPIIKALLELATEQNFADQSSLKELVKIFNELRVQFVDSLNFETEEEKKAEEKFADRVAQLEKEHAEFQRAVLIKNSELAANDEKLTETINFTEARKSDVATLQNQLQAENDNYARETDIYNELVTEYNHEITISEKAVQLLSSSNFESYVKSSVGF